MYGNVYVALPITLFTISTYFLLGQEKIDWELIGFIGSSTLFLYPFHRLLSLYRIDSKFYSKRLKRVAPFKNILILTSLIGGVLTFFFAIKLEYHVFLTIIPAGVISIGYSIPIVPLNGKWLRLRDFPGVKVLFIGIIVSWITYMIPVVAMGSTITRIEILEFILRILFIVAITLPFDIRDIKLDDKEGVQTIPILIGIPNTMNLIYGLLCLYGMGHVVLWMMIPSPILGISSLLLLCVSLFSILIIRLGQPFENSFYNAFLIEGTMVLQFILLSLLKFL